MNSINLRGVFAAVSGALMFGAANVAMADTTDDLLKALRDKGVLSQDEFDNFNARRDAEKIKDKPAVKNKLVLGDYIDSITPVGDVRVRYEMRKAEGNIAGSGHSGSEQLDRGRYAWHLGLKTSSDNDFFTELRFASNQSARSPNADFSSSVASSKDAGGPMYKGGTALVDRLYIGWKASDWMTLLAGRMQNPLYTTSLVWDGDLTPEGLAEKFQTKVGNTDLFATLGQFYIKGKWVQTVDNGVTTVSAANSTTKVFPIQVGAHYQINDESSIKVAPVLYSYGGNASMGIFNPGSGTGIGNTAVYGPGTIGINNLRVFQVPAEYNWSMAGLSWKAFGDYAYNLDHNARATAAGYPTQGGQDTALMVGLQMGSKMPLNKWESIGTYFGSTSGLKKHDWVGRVWYQRVEAFSLDPNLIDSDVMNAQVNLQGIAASGSFMLSDNAFVTLSGSHGTRIRSALGTGASVDTSSINPTHKYDLIQTDVTWKF